MKKLKFSFHPVFALLAALMMSLSCSKDKGPLSQNETNENKTPRPLYKPMMNWGLFCVPSSRLWEVKSSNITMVRPPYGTEGSCNYRNAGEPAALRQYTQDAIDAGIYTLLFQPDVRLFLLSQPNCTPLPSVANSKTELDSLFTRMKRWFGNQISLIAYRDEPSGDNPEVLAYAQQAAHANGISWYIATASSPGQWYYQYADELLITRYDVGSHKDNNPATTSDRWMDWTAKRNDYEQIRNSSGKPVLPIVAAHFGDSSAYGGFNDWWWPPKSEIYTYANSVAAYFDPYTIWIYCGNDNTQDLWSLPSPSDTQMSKVYAVIASWPYPPQ